MCLNKNNEFNGFCWGCSEREVEELVGKQI